MAINKNKLIQAAAKARLGSVSPYSKFKVGAALLSYGLTCCAERIALFKALTDRKKNFVAVAVTARCDGGPMPCGACRQLLREYAPDAQVLIADSADLKSIRAFTVKKLLPAAFVLVP